MTTDEAIPPRRGETNEPFLDSGAFGRRDLTAEFLDDPADFASLDS
jgi:hypothetical protein